MRKLHFILTAPNLQLFAQGAQDGAGGETGAESAAVAAQATQEGAEDISSRFSELIGGEFKDEFTRRTRSIIDKRFKETKRLEGEREALSPVLSQLYGEYGIEEGNIDALCTEFSKSRESKAENERSARERAKGDVERWMAEGEELKATYPAFDFSAQIRDSKDFVKLLTAGIPVKTAYEVLHKDEIIGSAMEFTAKKVSEQVVKGIEAKGMRPAENGVSTGSGLVTKTDVNSLTAQDVLRILKQVEEGASVTF